MLNVDGVPYRVCTWIHNLALLNILFLVSCIPIITVFPAFVALFGVVRQLVKGNEGSIFKSYRMHFLQNFKQSFIIGILYILIGLFLVVDIIIINEIQSNIRLIIFVCLILICSYFVLSILSLFSLMVNFHHSSKQVIINSIKFTIYKPHLTLLNLLVLIGILYLSLKCSFLFVFFTFSVSAYLTYWFANIKFLSLTLEVEKGTGEVVEGEIS